MDQSLIEKPRDGGRAELTQEQREAMLERLQALGTQLAKTRKEAVDGRKASGVEDIWREDEEHFEGIDDANRGQTGGSASKPPWQTTAAVDGDKSIEFVNITRPYVEAAAAKVGDILLPTDDRAWSIKETPIPELIERAKGKLDIDVIAGMGDMNVPEELALQVLEEEKADADRLIQEAKDKAKRAEKRIEDWHIECQWHAEVREVIDDMAKLGTGVLKGPIPEMKRQQRYDPENGVLVIKEEVKPVSKRIDPWNCFPDPACGGLIHKGRYHWERDYLTKKQLIELKSDPDYIGSQIDLCIEEGPQKKGEGRQQADGRYLDEQELYEIWYGYCYATREDLEAAGCDCKGAKTPLIPTVFTMVNDRVIKGALNHLDTGDFPYDYVPWQKRKNSPWGFGVARQIRTPQRIVNGATRAMLVNAGRAAGPMLVLRNHVIGADGNNDFRGWKVFYAGASDVSEDVNKVAALIEIPAMTDKLMAIIQYGMKLAEDVTGLPLLLQGQVGGAPETLGGQQLTERNAAGVLRRIARVFDDRLTEPHVRRYYTYLLMHGPEEIEKGEFVIDARGSTALVERDVNRQEVTALLEASLNPAFGLDPKKTMEQKLRADNRNPKDFQFTEEELEQQQAAAQQPQTDPRVEANKEIAQMKTQADMQALEFKAAEAEKDRAHKEKLALIARETALAGYAEKRGISIQDAKVELTKTVMQLRTQKELARTSGTGPQVTKPPTEPPGRAPNGRAYAQ